MPDGSKIRVHNEAQDVSDVAEFVQITSPERVKLNSKEQADIRHAITRKQHSLYNKVDLASTNLDELMGLQTNLESTERHFGKYDLLQIFKIVDPARDSNGKILPTLKAGSTYRNLFRWYAVLKVEDITASNQCYCTYPEDSWYNENMGLTYEYLKVHMAPDLWMKISEEYSTYPPEAKGGPLFLF
jgi:hypothetical protein